MAAAKLKFNKYWILVAVGIMANVFIFSFFSKQLEKKVFDDIISQAEEIDTEDLINELK
jgi:hypothetical protein